ncbi:MAG: hypothetical protein ABJN65_16830 [Parasphingorhabdus sp.]
MMKNIVSILTTLAALTGFSAVAASPKHNAYPHWSPDGQKIVFHSSRDGNYEIYVMDQDGGNPKRLTNNLATDRQPRWSPDGSRIVFQSDRDSLSFHGELVSEIYSMSAVGTDVIRLTKNRVPDIAPSYSPDGKTLAYVSGVRETANIKLLAVETGDISSLPLSPEGARLLQGNAGNPHWSRDGEKIYIDAQMEGRLNDLATVDIKNGRINDLTNDKIQTFYPSPSPDGRYLAFGASVTNTGVEQWDIFIMDIESRQITRITNDSAYEGWPEWSPDGNSLVFSRLVDGQLEIFTIEKSGSKAVQLTGQTDQSFNHPAWSPNGLKVAFDANVGGQKPEVYITDIDGTNVFRLTNNDSIDSHPYWSPDSKMISYESNRDGDFEIFIYDLVSNTERKITDDNRDNRLATWHPRGRKLIYSSRPFGGTSEIFEVDSENRKTASIVKHPANDSEPTFSPNGNRLAFRSDRNGSNRIHFQGNDGKIRLASDKFSNGSEPWWRGSSQTLVFYTHDDGIAQYVEINLEIGGVTKLNAPTDGYGIPSLGPDFKQFLFMRSSDNSRSIFRHDVETGTNLEIRPNISKHENR